MWPGESSWEAFCSLSFLSGYISATSAAVAGQSMRLPQIVKRSISSRSLFGILCFISEASCASPSSSVESEGAGGSGSNGGVGGRLAGVAGEASLSTGGNKSVLGVGWVVTEEEEDGGSGLQGWISSTFESPVKDSEQSFELFLWSLETRQSHSST